MRIIMSAFLSKIECLFVDWWPYFLGYAFSIIIAHYLILPLVKALWSSHPDQPHRGGAPASVVQGIFERLLYTASWGVGKPEFIGVWVVLKVASQWKHWSEMPGYNVFLVGSAASILYASVGAKLIEWLSMGEFLKAITLPPLIMILFTIALTTWVKRKSKDPEKN
jgi:hypothetical protein